MMDLNVGLSAGLTELHGDSADMGPGAVGVALGAVLVASFVLADILAVLFWTVRALRNEASISYTLLRRERGGGGLGWVGLG